MTSTSTDEQMKIKWRRALIVLAAVIILIGLPIIVYKLTLGRPILVGNDRHDFGVLLIPQVDASPMIMQSISGTYAGSDEVTADHEFVLTNRTSRPVTIRNIATSCGCITATGWQPETVEPGEEVVISVQIALRTNGVTNERVLVEMFDDDGSPLGVRTLHVSSAAQEQRQLRTTRPAILLTDDVTEVLTVRVHVWPGDLEPDQTEPEVRVEHGELITVTQTQLRKVSDANARRHQPQTWTAQYEVALAKAIDWDEQSGDIQKVIRFDMDASPAIEFPVTIAQHDRRPGADRPARDQADHDEPFNPLEFAPGS